VILLSDVESIFAACAAFLSFSSDASYMCACRSYDGEEDVPKAFKARMSQVSAGQQSKPSKQKSLLGSLAR